jgi:hypothetical protein
MKMFSKRDCDYVLQIGHHQFTFEHPRRHYVPGIVYWPGLDSKGNTLRSRRIFRLPRWIFFWI